MIYIDESTIKVGGVILPGLFKSIEVKTDALVEEQTVEGKTEKPKQATGYEDAKVNMELILYDGPTLSKVQKLQVIQNLFRKSGQSMPIVYEIINEHTAARGVTKVIFKNLTTKEQNKNDELLVTIEFWQYVAITITAKKTSSSSASKTSTAKAKLTSEYKSYLENRGAAPKIQDKTIKTVAKDTASTQVYKNKVGHMPY